MQPKLGLPLCGGVGERPMRGEVAAEAAVDFMGVRMPE